MIRKALPMAEPYIDTRVMSMLEAVNHKAVILDIASGQGYLSEQLADLGYRFMHCADVNAKNFKLNKQKFHFQKVDANQPLPYRRNQFDVVISCETIEHLENPRQFFREVSRILKPQGLLILSTPNIECIISRLYFFFTGRLAFHTDNDYHLSGHITVTPTWLLHKFAHEAGLVNARSLFSSFYIPLLKWRLTQPLFLNRFFGWVGIYSYTKS